MCGHAIAIQVDRSQRLTSPADKLAVECAYDRYGAQVFGMLMQVTRCEPCAVQVMVVTFANYRTGEEHELASLLRTAFLLVTTSCEPTEAGRYRNNIREACPLKIRDPQLVHLSNP